MTKDQHDQILESYRRDTPGANNIIHLNNAGAALSPEPVVRTIVDYIYREAQIGGYEAASEAKERISLTYENIAKVIAAKETEVAFMDSATRAWNTLVYSFPLSPGDRILTSQNEFGSNAVSLAQVASRTGAQIEVIPNEDNGQVSVSKLKNSLDRTVKLVAITHIPAQRGVVNPVVEIGGLLEHHPAFYLVDACQSIGQVDVDVNNIKCDALVATGRKWLRGPRGTGFLFLREEWITKIEPYTVDLASADLVDPEQMLRDTRLEIRSDIKRFETWERSFAVMLGLGSAVEYAMQIGIERIHNSVAWLASLLREGAASIKGISVEDAPNANCGIVTLTAKNRDASEIRKALSDRGINTSVVQGYDGPLDFPSRNLVSALRVSPHYYNSQEDIERFLDALADICRN